MWAFANRELCAVAVVVDCCDTASESEQQYDTKIIEIGVQLADDKPSASTEPFGRAFRETFVQCAP